MISFTPHIIVVFIQRQNTTLLDVSNNLFMFLHPKVHISVGYHQTSRYGGGGHEPSKNVHKIGTYVDSDSAPNIT